MNSDRLILKTLRCYHDVCSIQHKNVDLFQIEESELQRPIWRRSRGAYHNVTLNLISTIHWNNMCVICKIIRTTARYIYILKLVS